MNGEMLIRLFYGIMIVGMLFCFVFSKNHSKDIRKEANGFVFAFVKLSNYISSPPPHSGLQAESLGEGKVRVLPLEQQSEAIRVIVKRAGTDRAVQMFRELNDAAELVAKRAGFNRTHKVQFVEPLDQLLMLTHSFLVGCEDLSSIDTEEKLADFNSYLLEQPKHRMVMIKRISGDMAEEYRKLNKNYAAEMERIEAEENAARKKGKK